MNLADLVPWVYGTLPTLLTSIQEHTIRTTLNALNTGSQDECEVRDNRAGNTSCVGYIATPTGLHSDVTTAWLLDRELLSMVCVGSSQTLINVFFFVRTPRRFLISLHSLWRRESPGDPFVSLRDALDSDASLLF